MKAIVCVKRVIDYNVKIRVKSDNSGVETENVKMSMNPFDEIAVEEAVKMKERNEIDEIVVVSIGSSSSQETIRSGLAMGGDRGIHVITNESLEPLAVAKILSKIIEKESPKIVFLGKQAIDDDSNQTGQMLSAISGFSQATFASKVIKKENFLEVTREIDGGLETIKISLPSIVTTDLRLNEPRYASLPNIMKARQKKIDNINIEDLNVDVKSRLTILKVNDPPERKAGVMVKDIDELVDKLKNEAKVL
tara:strand:- start:2789 stop:3538 length:750 start_codon:yes stop_codon:yes gene_type:complete